MGLLDKVRKMSEKNKPASRVTTTGIYHDWKDGKNTIRLVGEFLEVRTHFIAHSPKMKNKALCNPKAFEKGEGSLPKVINCPDWDVEKEEWKSVKVCPICRLNELARKTLGTKQDSAKLDPEERKFFEELRTSSRPRITLKWNIFDRDEPNITVIDNGVEKKQKGLKIASFGNEVWKAVEAIFDQCQMDITDPVEGIDIEVEKSSGAKTSYTAKACISGKGLKLTPFTDEEKELAAKAFDLKIMCGKQVDPGLIQRHLLQEYADLLAYDSAKDESLEEDKSFVEEEEEEAPVKKKR